MTMSDESQQTDLFQTELESMSLQEDSHAKTSQPLADRQALTVNVADSGQSAPVYLGTFDPDTPSLKTSQTCLLETGEIGLSEFSGAFPRSGTMLNGTVYQLPNLAHTTTEIGSGLWPTPAARDYKGARRPETMAKTGRNPETNSLPDSVEFKGESGRLNPTWVEWLMGFPLGHTDLDV